MNNNHLQHVKQNSKLCLGSFEKELKTFDWNILIFDTESCSAKRGCDKSAKVYSWGLGCTGSEKMIYGLDLNHFLKSIYVITDYHFNNVFNKKVKKTRKGYPKELYINIPIAVHNLGWDMEFLKYFLYQEGFEYKMAEIKAEYKPTLHYRSITNKEPMTYHIVQADNNVYGSEVFLPFRHKIVNRDKSITKIGYCLDFFDTFKIMNCSIDNIGSFTKGMDDMFNKMSTSYDYETFREKGQKPTDLELRYLYNDIYRLRRAVQDFYLKILNDYDLPMFKRTASSIAFEILKMKSFGDSKTYNKVYKEYFEIDDISPYELTRKKLEAKSYQGGYTHTNHLYIDNLLVKDGCSFDINSSYPSQMAYKVQPYGKPISMTNGEVPKVDNEKRVALIEIAFDYAKPKKDKFNLPVFKIRSMNARRLKTIYGDLSGNEYFATNIYKGNVIEVFNSLYDGVDETTLTANYQLACTSVEYEFFIKHFDFGCFKDDIGEELEFNGLEIGNCLVYKAETGRMNNFVQHFTKMKVLYKGRSSTQIKADILQDKNYYDGILTLAELKIAMEKGVKADPVLVAFAKLVLNSSYGKFGTKTLKREVDLFIDHNGLFKNTSPNDIETIEYETSEFYRPYASFVTAHGRLQLWNTIIYAIGVNNFLYCDTDSIYCIGKKEDVTNRMNKIGETVDKTILGKWDCETEFTSFKVLGQKKYMLQLKNKKFKVKCCGLPKSAQNKIADEGYKNFYLGSEVDGKKQKSKVIGGALLKNVKYKLQKVMFS